MYALNQALEETGQPVQPRRKPAKSGKIWKRPKLSIKSLEGRKEVEDEEVDLGNRISVK